MRATATECARLCFEEIGDWGEVHRRLNALGRRKYGVEWAGLDKRLLVAYMISREVLEEARSPGAAALRRRAVLERARMAAALAREVAKSVAAAVRAAEALRRFAASFGPEFEALAAKMSGDAVKKGGGRTGG